MDVKRVNHVMFLFCFVVRIVAGDMAMARLVDVSTNLDGSYKFRSDDS